MWIFQRLFVYYIISIYLLIIGESSDGYILLIIGESRDGSIFTD